MPFAWSASRFGAERTPGSRPSVWRVLTGWDPALVAEGLEQLDDPHFVALLVPPGLDDSHVAQTAAGVSATARLHDLTQEILAGVLDDESWSPSPDELDRIAAEWTDWRDAESGGARQSS